MKHPHQFTKRILLAVSGLSQQILTETLYGLTVATQTPFIPTEIHLITTIEGAHRAKLDLLHQETGKFPAFCKKYQLPPIQFPENLLKGAAGFLETINLARKAEFPPELIIDVAAKKLSANGILFTLPDILFAFYCWVIKQTIKQQQILYRPVVSLTCVVKITRLRYLKSI